MIEFRISWIPRNHIKGMWITVKWKNIWEKYICDETKEQK